MVRSCFVADRLVMRRGECGIGTRRRGHIGKIQGEINGIHYKKTSR